MAEQVKVTFVNNSKLVLSELEEKVKLALDIIGEKAEGHAKRGCPVDTGRLRGSITYATVTTHSGGDSPAGGKDFELRGKPEANTVYIGTNVEYAPAVEYGEKAVHITGGAHFLKNAIANHAEQYKNVVKTILSD